MFPGQDHRRGPAIRSEWCHDPAFRLLLLPLLGLPITGCEYAGLLRPSVLSQLDPPTVRLLNELPEVDRPNEATLARLFATGGLARAEPGADGVLRAASTCRRAR